MILVDAHVHFYECYDLEVLLDHAFKNFAYQARKLQKTDDFSGVLLLADRMHQHNFSMLVKSVKSNERFNIGKWQVVETDEPFTLKFISKSNTELYLINGWQTVSQEGLEVLSLISNERQLPEGSKLSDMIDLSTRASAVTVLPWAFGKWMGARGKVLGELSEQIDSNKCYLGDNGGRPWFISSKILNNYKNKRDFVLVSGSDPLPLQNEEKRVGSCGNYINAQLQDGGVGEQLADIISNQPKKIGSFGKPLSIFDFLRLQYLLRRKK